MSKKKGSFKQATEKILVRDQVEDLNDFLDEEKEDDNIYHIPIEKIKSNPYQPRKEFDEEKLQELSDSIKQSGVIQPIVIRQEGDEIFLVAGERRLRASKMAEIDKIPAIVSKGNPLEISLIENLQREDLDPFEEAEALKTMIDKYEYTQERLSQVVGKSRPSITRSLSLNKIPGEIKEKCARAHIPKRTLIEVAKLQTVELMTSLVERIISNNLKSDDVRKLTRKAKKKKQIEEPNKIAYKKVRSFNKFISGIEDKIDDNYAEALDEMAILKDKISEILEKFEEN